MTGNAFPALAEEAEGAVNPSLLAEIPFCNNPDLALPREWISSLDEAIASRGLEGYDPFDIKQHPWIRAAQPNRWTRRATTLLCDLWPLALRRLLKIPPTTNPKAPALMALGKLRLYQITQAERHLDAALGYLDWLRANSTPGYAGLCWGYPFDIKAKGLDTPKGTPIAVISAIAGEAFLLAHAVTGEQRHLDDALSIAEFMLADLPRMESEDGLFCFGYTPSDMRRVHNANLLVVQHLVCTGAAANKPELAAEAEAALRFTLGRQRQDGAWFYGEYQEGDPYERGILEIIDHHHTGFVLRSLLAMIEQAGREDLMAPLEKGFQFYRGLLTPKGMPINDFSRYPVDIHACAEATLCGAMLAGRFAPARRMTVESCRWAWYFLRDRESNLTWYRKYPFHTARISFPRWGDAWMFRALAEYLYRFRGEIEQAPGGGAEH